MQLPILLDGTYFEPYEVLPASIPRGGRALPIAWYTYHRRLDGENELSRNLIEHGFRDRTHHLHLRIPASRLVHSSRRAATLVNAIVLAYWFLCLVGIRALPRAFQRQLTSWGKASFFRMALELVSSIGPMPCTIPKMLTWVDGKLAYHHPPLTFWQRDYLRRRARSG